jgi:hypothetical protein
MGISLRKPGGSLLGELGTSQYEWNPHPSPATTAGRGLALFPKVAKNSRRILPPHLVVVSDDAACANHGARGDADPRKNDRL